MRERVRKRESERWNEERMREREIYGMRERE